MSAFLEALQSGPVLLMDGAMGTELQRAGIRDGECYEAWNLTQPDRVLAIHRAYVQAGAEVLLANTFQANRATLARHGLAQRMQEIVEAGLRLARAALAGRGFVLADIGPLAGADRQEIGAILDAIAGADALLLETFSDPDLASAIVAAHRAGPLADLPVLISFTFGRTGPTRTLATFKGHLPAVCAHKAEAVGAAALGVNCGRDLGVEDIREILHIYQNETDLPLFARPNAGTPQKIGASRVYPHSAGAMSAWLPALVEAGVRMVGGCCGTTPEHIAAFREVLDSRR